MAERKFPGKRSKEKASRVETVAYRFRGYPSENAEKVLMQNINGTRGFWNILVSDGEEYYKTTGKRLKKTPAQYKKSEGHEWLADLDSLALANVQLNYEKAMDAFLKKDVKYPKKKKKGKCRASYTTNVSNKKKPNLSLHGDMLKLPKMEERIKLLVHRKIRKDGFLKNCTICKEADGWYFSLIYEYPKTIRHEVIQKKTAEEISHIGLDMSVAKLYVDSNGNDPDFLKPYRAAEKRLKLEQKKLSRKISANIERYEIKNGHRYPVYKRPLEECKNIQKQKERVSLLYARTKRIRKDILHKLSAEMTDSYELISIENLDIAAMKKTLRLGKSISDNGWGEFASMLKYKQENKGHTLIRVDKWFPSSKTCIKCGRVHKELKLSDRLYVCPLCGNSMNRDYQAAMNIDKEGLRIYRDSMGVSA